MKRIYICSESITGIFSAIYDAWKCEPDGREFEIVFYGKVEQQLFSEYLEVEATDRKARAVENLIKKHLGEEAYFQIYHALMSNDDGRASAVLGMMMEARRLGKGTQIINHLSHPDVQKVFKLSRNVGNEAHRFLQFVRFRELQNGLLFASITPQSQVLTSIADHFANRLPLENWMIYDKTHETFLVHPARKQWVLVEGEQIDWGETSKVTDAQKHFQHLWQGFFSSISIKERYNLQLQRQHLPIRYQQDVVEFHE